MGTAHEETGHGHADRRTPQSAVKIGEAAGRRAAVTPRPVRHESVADALPPRTQFDSQQWLNSREPAGRSRWLKRGGAVLVAGLFGTLGWVGYQQMPKASAEGTVAAAEENIILDGAVATPGEVDIALEKPAMRHERVESMESPFDAPTAFRQAPRPVMAAPEPTGGAEANPFAEFTPAVTKTAMAPEAVQSFGETATNIATSQEMSSGVVTLASNEAAAPTETVQGFEVGGQTEPAVTEAPAQIELNSPTAVNEDPFAAFAPQPPAMAGASSSVPATLGGQSSQPSAAADAEWTVAGQGPAVTPVQFNADSAPFGSEPAQLPPPAPFEPEARPIGAANEFVMEPAAPLHGSNAQIDWPAADQQPAAMQPLGGVRRPATEPAYSPMVEKAQSTSFDVPRPAAPGNDPADERLHVVQQGETYWSIARQHYGAGRYFQALAEYNKPRISDQQSLKPGMKVLVPSATTLDVRYGKLMQASGHAKPPAKPRAGLRFNAQGEPFYIVGEGDTLGDIATRHLGKTLRSEEIYRLNKEQLPAPNNLKVGMVLVMPADASEVQQASAVSGRR